MVEDKIEKWIYGYKSHYTDKEDFYKKIEQALGFKLFFWQKSYIETGIFRRYGESTAKCLRYLLSDVNGVPLDYSKRENMRQEYFKKQMKEIEQKLNNNGIQTRKILWNESQKREYEQQNQSLRG